jgi:hypothetical protein
MRALNAAADYVAGELQSAGLAVGDEAFRAEGERFRNILGTHTGTAAPQEQVLVVAHYDTKPGTPGADDNASGVAAMLEIARTLARRPFARTLQFVGFTLEEYGYQGSRRFARRARRDGREIVGVLDLEMVGFTSPATRWTRWTSPFSPRSPPPRPPPRPTWPVRSCLRLTRRDLDRFVRTLRSPSSPGIFDRPPPSRQSARDRGQRPRRDVRRVASFRQPESA